MEVVSFFSFMFLAVSAVPTWPFHQVDEKYVDLSYNYDNSTMGWVEQKPYRMNVTLNGTTEYDGLWMQEEEIATGTHIGTHMDAPCHGAKGRWTLNDIPLERFFAPAAVVDITFRARFDSDALLQIEDLQRWEAGAGRTLDGTVVLVRSGWGSRWPDRKLYLGNANNDIDNLHFPGVSEEAAMWLVQNRKIYGLGVDTLTLDSGKNIALRTLPAHKYLLGANVYGLENVANLHKLPLYGAMLYVLPMKLAKACGAPARIIAYLPTTLH